MQAALVVFLACLRLVFFKEILNGCDKPNGLPIEQHVACFVFVKRNVSLIFVYSMFSKESCFRNVAIKRLQTKELHDDYLVRKHFASVALHL